MPRPGRFNHRKEAREQLQHGKLGGHPDRKDGYSTEYPTPATDIQRSQH